MSFSIWFENRDMIAKGYKRMASIKYGPHAGKPGWYHPGTRQVVPDEEIEGGAEHEERAVAGAEAEAPEPEEKNISDEERKIAEDIFRKYPEMNTVFVEVGHGFGKAKYDGKCKLTGASVLKGRVSRHIRGITRDGKTFDTYTTNEMLDAMNARSLDGQIGASPYQPCSGDWWINVEKAVAAGRGLLVVLENSMYATRSKSWLFNPREGTWANNWPARGVSTKQLIASLKRSSRHGMWMLDLTYPTHEEMFARRNT